MKIKVPNNTAQLGVEISDLNLSGEFSDDQIAEIRKSWTCLLYTSDAADE